MVHYLIDVWGCVEPSLMGPYSSVKQRDRVAKEKNKKQSNEDALFWLDVDVQGMPTVGAFTNTFFEEEEDEPKILGTCPLCAADVFDTDSGTCCRNGHGGVTPVTEP